MSSRNFDALLSITMHAVGRQEHDRVGPQAPAFFVLGRELQQEVAALLRGRRLSACWRARSRRAAPRPTGLESERHTVSRTLPFSCTRPSSAATALAEQRLDLLEDGSRCRWRTRLAGVLLALRRSRAYGLRGASRRAACAVVEHGGLGRLEAFPACRRSNSPMRCSLSARRWRAAASSRLGGKPRRRRRVVRRRSARPCASRLRPRRASAAMRRCASRLLEHESRAARAATMARRTRSDHFHDATSLAEARWSTTADTVDEARRSALPKVLPWLSFRSSPRPIRASSRRRSRSPRSTTAIRRLMDDMLETMYAGAGHRPGRAAGRASCSASSSSIARATARSRSPTSSPIPRSSGVRTRC